jgi:integration host factor subunit alpha
MVRVQGSESRDFLKQHWKQPVFPLGADGGSWRIKMTQRTITRAELSEAVYERIGLSRTDSSELVELVLREISDTLAAGETVKLSSFGSFVVRDKGARVGRNPKTGIEVPIEPRRVLSFKPSNILKQRINKTAENA